MGEFGGWGGLLGTGWHILLRYASGEGIYFALPGGLEDNVTSSRSNLDVLVTGSLKPTFASLPSQCTSNYFRVSAKRANRFKRPGTIVPPHYSLFSSLNILAGLTV